jgi:hypothetical protein
MRRTKASESPDLIWDRATKRLDLRVGGLVAEDVEDSDLGPIVAKWLPRFSQAVDGPERFGGRGRDWA